MEHLEHRAPGAHVKAPAITRLRLAESQRQQETDALTLRTCAVCEPPSRDGLQACSPQLARHARDVIRVAIAYLRIQRVRHATAGTAVPNADWWQLTEIDGRCSPRSSDRARLAWFAALSRRGLTPSFMPTTSMRASALSLLAVAFVGCGDATSAGRSSTSLLVAGRTSSSLAVSRALLDISMTAGGHSLVIGKAQMVLAEMELKATSSSACAAEAAEDDCTELQVAPIVVDLPLGAVKSLDVSALLPPGTYREIELDVDAVESGEHATSAAFHAAHPDFRNVSVRVTGTFDGSPFIFETAQDFEVELEFPSPFVVGAGASSLTLNIDVASWFQVGSTILDPSNPENRSVITNNIGRSIAAFRDDDRDGREDR